MSCSKYVNLLSSASDSEILGIVVDALEDISVFSFKDILSHPAFINLSNSSTEAKNMYNLVEIFAYGTLANYNDSKCQLILSERMRKKLCMLTLISAASESLLLRFDSLFKLLQNNSALDLAKMLVILKEQGMLVSTTDVAARTVTVKHVVPRDLRFCDYEKLIVRTEALIYGTISAERRLRLLNNLAIGLVKPLGTLDSLNDRAKLSLILGLVSFISSDRMDVRSYATNYISSFSKPGTESFDHLARNPDVLVKSLLLQCRNEPLLAHDSVKILINVTSVDKPRGLFDSVGNLQFVVEKILDPNNVIADLYCMLLSNLCKKASICEKLVSLKTDFNKIAALSSQDSDTADPAKKMKPESLSSDSQELVLDLLTDYFVRGVTPNSPNPKANFNFLASVFADISATKQGRDYFLTPNAKNEYPISKIIVFTEYKEVIRRGGSINTIKNVCFAKDSHALLLDPKGINVLPYILLPLCGSDDFDLEEMDQMPEEVQFLPPDKQRETDDVLRLSLIESLILLCTERESREYLREKQVYPIVRQLHLAIPASDVKSGDAIDRLVQLLMREESSLTASGIKEIPDDSDMFEEI
ncbi:hypothetical protein BB560_004224 [Smittium megazygosporum]|uniref:Protein HGH1 homolog n=1 Tax=Smittium megazygosporum TaxID=133381 RepID=A0A2T9Z9X0_9FUNG|nr:hypothetical protein BB560_004224 [Smittium megazygosporum]